MNLALWDLQENYCGPLWTEAWTGLFYGWKAYKNRGRFDAAKTYVVHNPQENVDGADLFCEYCDEEYLDERVDLQQGFQPHAPVFLADHEGSATSADEWHSEISDSDLIWSENDQSEVCSEWSETPLK